MSDHATDASANLAVIAADALTERIREGLGL